MISFNFASKQFEEITNILKEYKHINNIGNYEIIELDTNAIKFVSIDPNVESISISANVNITTCVYLEKIKIIVGFTTDLGCEYSTMIESNII